MKRAMAAAAAVVWTVWAADAEAQGVGGTAKIGTLGVGGDATVGLFQNLNLRAGYNQFTYKDDVEFGDEDVDGEVDLETIPLLLDWHCFGGGFRLSAGAMVNNNEVQISAEPGDVLVLEGVPFTVQSLQGSVTFEEWSWYGGFGYGNAVGRDGRWHFACDFGVLFHGDPVVEARAVSSAPAVQPLLDAAVAAEVAELQDDLKDFTFYPVVSVGISLRF